MACKRLRVCRKIETSSTHITHGQKLSLEQTGNTRHNISIMKSGTAKSKVYKSKICCIMYNYFPSNKGFYCLKLLDFNLC